ncbi:MAG TPA: MBL fold metallo-hydrolase [Chloroflexia bacterium]|nr:MBL fold metallo-hydrolase [Chloroflexia bacterium]
MQHPVTFRWFGVAGVAITANGQTLALDPFFSRPPYSRFLLGRPVPSRRLAEHLLPACDYVLVSHSHWDHVMDVPAVARHTGAIAFGSPNTCGLLRLHGVPAAQIRLIQAGEHLRLGSFGVEVLRASHGFVPFLGGVGPLASDLRPPLRLRDYRRDVCFGFRVEVAGYRLLLLPGRALPADVLFMLPVMRGPAYYGPFLRRVQPAVVVPVHWDNLFLPLTQPLREYGRGTARLKQYVEHYVPGARFLKPELFRPYSLPELLADRTAGAR